MRAARWRVTWSVACLALGCALSTSARAAEGWLSARGSPRCAVTAERLAARIAGAVVGELAPELRATIVLRDAQQGTSATLALAQGSRSLGRRQLVAASCEEAVDAVVAVTALALSSTLPAAPAQAGDGEVLERRVAGPREAQRLAANTVANTVANTAEVQQHAPLRVQQSAAASSAREPVTPVDSGSSAGSSASAARGALLLSTAAELAGGTTALLSLGAALRSGQGTWRAQLWYALPTVLDDEEALPQRSLQARSERGALALDYCRAAGALRWLAACGGLELGAERHWQAESLAGQPRRERSWLEPGLAALLGSRLTYPELPWQPGLELTMLLPLLDAAEGRRVGLRAQAGVAVPF